MRFSAAIGTLTFIPLFFFSCGGKAPQIFGADYRLFVEGSPQSYRERLALSMVVNDDDGFEDIESLYLVSDEAQLYWKASSADFVVKGEGRFGVSSMVSAYGASFPRGNYRVIVIDKAGQRAERALVIAPPDADPSKIPLLGLDAGIATIKTAFNERYLQLLDSTGAVIGSYKVNADKVDVSTELPTEALSQARTIRLFCVSESHSLYYVSKEQAINDERR